MVTNTVPQGSWLQLRMLSLYIYIYTYIYTYALITCQSPILIIKVPGFRALDGPRREGCRREDWEEHAGGVSDLAVGAATQQAGHRVLWVRVKKSGP